MAAAAGSAVSLSTGIAGYTGFVNQLATISSQFARMGTAAERVGDDLQLATGGFRAFNAVIAGTQATVDSVGRAFGTVTAPLRALGTGLGSLLEIAEVQGTRALAILGDLTGAFAGLGTAGAAGIGALGAAFASGVGASIGFAARFHRELTDLRAITQATPPEIARLDTEVRSLALQFAATVPEIQRVALELQKAGISTDAISAGFLKVALSLQQLSKGELTSEGAGQGLGSLFNLFRVQFEASGESAENFARRLGNATSVAANTTRATIPEVLSGITKLGPAFAAQGRTIEETFAALTLILKSGLRGEEAGTGLRNLFNFIINPSRDALRVIKELGLQEISPFDVEGNIRPALDVLRAIQEVFSKGGLEARGLTPAQGVTALTEVFQTRAFTTASLAILQGKEGLQEFFDELERADVVAQANSQMDTLLRQLERIRNATELAAIAFGRNFLDSLTGASKGIVDFFTDKRLEAKSGALEGGLASILTGQGGQGAFEGISQQFDAGAADQFGNIFNQVQSLKGELEPLVNSAGRLKDVFLGTIFPEGIPDDLGRVGEALSAGIDLAERFTNFLADNLPDGAKNFQTLAGEALEFAGRLKDIVNQGEGFDQIQAVATSLAPLFGALREEFGRVAISAAEFVRTVIDNRDQIIGALTAMVRVAGLLERVFVGLATWVVAVFGGIGKIAATAQGAVNEIDRLSRAQSAAAAARGEPVIISGRGARTFTARNTPAPIPTDLSGQSRDTERVEAADRSRASAEAEVAERVRVATEANNEYLRSIGLLPAAQDDAAAAAAAAAQAAVAGAGAYSQDREAKAAAERATKALESAQDRLAESSEDAARSARTAFRQLQSSLEGIEQRWLDAMESIAEQTEDSFRQITEGAQEQRQTLQDAFQIRAEQEGEQFSLRRRHERENRIFQEALEDRRLLRQQDRENADVVDRQQSEDRLRIFSQGEDAITRERTRGLDDFNRAFARSQEDLGRGFQRTQEDAQRALSRGFDVVNLQAGRGTEDSRRGRDLARSLAKAKTEEERRGLQERFSEESVSLQERRAEEDVANARRLSQEQQLLGFRRAQEESFQGFKRAQENTEIERKRSQEEDDLRFRIGMELRLIFFRRQEETDSRNRSRLLDARELLTRRDETTEGLGEADRQLAESRNLQRQQAVADLDRQIAAIDSREEKSLSALFEQIGRRQSTANRTADRERQTALRQHNSALEGVNEKMGDQATDITRQFTRMARDANREFEGPALEKVLGAIQTSEAAANAAVNQARAVAAAQGIIAGQTAEQTIEQARSRLSQMTATVLVQSPQVERLTQAVEQLTNRINQIAPGTTNNIDEINVELSGPQTVGQIVGGLVGAL